MLNTTILGLCGRFLSRSRVMMGAAAAAGTASLAHNEPTADAPESDSLVQVVYVTRHGLRTPLSDSNETVRELPWECISHDETLRVFSEDIELYRADQGPERGSNPSEVARSRLPPGRFDAQFSGDKLANFGKNCHSGQLTLAGHKQMRAVGEKIGERYKEGTGLLSPEWRPEDVHIRSTNSERTIETALEIITGMFPDRIGKAPIRIELHSVAAETMYPHSSCTFIGDTYKSWRKSEARQEIRDAVQKIFDKSQFDSEEDYSYYTRRSLPAICNTVATLVGHGFPLPNGIRPEQLDQVCDLSGVEYGRIYGSDKRLTRLGIGSFLGEVFDVLNDKVEHETTKSSEKVVGVTETREKAPAKFVIMSGHDNTIAPLMKALELHDGIHPPMGSGLAFELYEKRSKNAVEDSEFFVQTVFNGTPLSIPACDGHLKCPFDKFTRIVAARSPANYHSECTSEKSYDFPPVKPRD